MAAIKPATPLPWTDPRTTSAPWSVWAGDVQVATCRVVYDDGEVVPYMVKHDGDAQQNTAYIVAAANNYPRLVEALKDVLSAHKFDGSPMNKARALLSELGEA